MLKIYFCHLLCYLFRRFISTPYFKFTGFSLQLTYRDRLDSRVLYVALVYLSVLGLTVKVTGHVTTGVTIFVKLRTKMFERKMYIQSPVS